MDYGYQLLRHVVQQVFGNLGAAARITLALYALPVIVLIATTGTYFFSTQVAGLPDNPGAVFGGLALTVIVAIVAYCWAAIGWHRYVLLEEISGSIFPRWHKGLVASYFGRAVIIGLILIVVMIGAGIVLALVLGAFGSVGLALIMGIGLVFFVSWVATRMGLILPAAALGQRMTIGESWNATAPVSSQILLPLIVFAIVFGLLGQLNTWVFGIPVPGFEGLAETPMAPGMQQPVALTPPGIVVGAVLAWLQVLMNLALLTTLYGNLVEGRQLN